MERCLLIIKCIVITSLTLNVWCNNANSQTISTVAGSANTNCDGAGDGGQATNATLCEPHSMCLDAVGNIYIADAYNHCIRKVSYSTGIISTIAGTGWSGYSGDGGAATSAKLNLPWGVCVDASGNVYIADRNNSVVRKITVSTGIITTIAGNGTFGDSGDGGLATNASIYLLSGICLDASGNIYFSDNYNHKIRKVTIATGIINSIAGTGIAGYSGDGGNAIYAQLNTPNGVSIDAIGNIYIADAVNYCIRKINSSTGIISTVAGNGIPGFSGDGGIATSAQMSPNGVFVDFAGNIYLGELARVRKITASTGIINTIAGNGILGFSGDGGNAINAQLKNASVVSVDQSGNLFIADQTNRRIRKVSNNQPYCDFNYSINNMVVDFTRTNSNCTSFIWDFGNGNTSTINPNPIVTYATPGTYSPCFQCNTPVYCLSCINIAVPGNSTGGTTGIVKLNDKSSITVYPNPSSDFITIENGKLSTTYIILNPIGQTVLSGKLTSEKTTIDIVPLPSGIYLLQIGKIDKESFKLIKN
jgi:PKD repeat protein